MESYDWPGNIRELRHIIERCVLLASNDVFPEQWLQLPNSPNQTLVPTENGIFLPLDGTLTMNDMKKYIIQEVLARIDNKVTCIFCKIGFSVPTLMK